MERVTADKQLRAMRVLLLSCIVFAAATAAFAWTTIRVHDRQVAAQRHEKAVASLLGMPGLRSGQAAVAGGGTVSVFYSAAAREVAVTGHDLPALGRGVVYELWYRGGDGRGGDGQGGDGHGGDGQGRRLGGESRFDTPEGDVVVFPVVGAVSSVVVTVGRGGGAAGAEVAEVLVG